MKTSGHVCDIPTLLSFFFQLHHDQSTLNRISFFRKMCFYCYFCPFLSMKLFLHNYNVITGSDM